MTPDRRRFLILLMFSAVVGWIAWSGHVHLLPVAALFPALWSLTSNRWQAAAAAGSYFLVASCGLPQGVAGFYATDLGPGLLVWLLASLSFVSVHGLAWTIRQGWPRTLGYGLGSIGLAIPPFGIFGWAHPWTAAGVIFPGWGWFGLLAMVAFLAAMTGRWRLYAALALCAFWSFSALTWTDHRSVPGWHGVDLQMGASLGREVSLARQIALIDGVRAHAPGSTVVLPESALGFWTPPVARVWQNALSGHPVTVIAGAAEVSPSGYYNLLVAIDADGAAILYRQRMAVPGSMWQPWLGLFGKPGGVQVKFFANPVVMLGKTKVAPLICYEQLLIWPILQSALHRPDVILAVGNGWWTSGTSIVEIQKANMDAWSRLFGIPLITAFNR